MLRSVFLSLSLLLTTNPAIYAGATNSGAPLKAISETDRLASEHAIEEVRAAIRLCREGKYKDAVPVLTKHAAADDVGASFVLAKLHEGGLGVEMSSKAAEKLLIPNVEFGHAPSMLALAAIKRADAPAEALQLYKQAAALKEPVAMLNLATIYENGLLGMKANPRMAFNMYEKVQRIGHPLGDYQVARCYDDGISVSPDALKATRLYRKSALAGVPIAQLTMARRYHEGLGVEVDPAAALGWLTLATQSGSTEAMILLGQRYEHGELVKPDLNAAGQLYSRAAQSGDPVGRYHLSQLYLHGKGTAADVIRAYVLLEGAQSIPKAKEAFEELSKKMTPEQIASAKRKIAEGKGK